MFQRASPASTCRSCQTLARMQNPSFGAVKLVLALALTVCVLGACELGSRIYALSYFAELQRQSAPMSAEAVASKAAPLLRAASNAEPVYVIVQSQHVDLSTKHELLSELSANWQAEATVALIAVIVLAVLLVFAYWAVATLERRYASRAHAG
jgi:hypothetical protein